jgi:hypothetical protein
VAGKVSKVNIGITGDASGLAKATDVAAARLRGLRAEADKTRKQMQNFKGTANQTAESLAKFGVGPRGLQGIAAIAGLASMGRQGAALGSIGIMLATATTGLAVVNQAIEQIPEQRRKALEALKQRQRIGGKPLSEFGLTERLARGAAGIAPPTVAEQLGMFGGFNAAFAAQNTPKSRTLRFIAGEAPGMAGAFLGTTAGGGGFAEARRNMLETGFGSSNMLMITPRLMQIYDDADKATYGLLRMLTR